MDKARRRKTELNQRLGLDRKGQRSGAGMTDMSASEHGNSSGLALPGAEPCPRPKAFFSQKVGEFAAAPLSNVVVNDLSRPTRAV